MENQHVRIYQNGDQVICTLGEQNSVEGKGDTVLEALTELYATMQSSIYSNSYQKDCLLEQLLALNALMAEYNHLHLEKL